MKKGGPLPPDVDECRLHTGKDPADAPFTYATHETALVRSLDKDLLEDPVLDQSDARLGGCDVDKEFGAHRGIVQ